MKLFLINTLERIGSKSLRILFAIVIGLTIDNWKYILYLSVLYGLIRLIAQLIVESMVNKEYMQMVSDAVLAENELPQMNKAGRLFLIFLVNTVFVFLIGFGTHFIKSLF